MRLLALPLLLIAVAGCAASPHTTHRQDDTASVEQMCAIAQCIDNLSVRLRGEDGSLFEKTYDAMPVVQESGVSVYAGQTVRFEADVIDGRLANLRRVDTVTNPDKTIEATLEQQDDGSMLLSTRNPFDRQLRIRMGIMPLAHDRLVRTSSCPVIAGGGSFEMWPYPIFQVFLGEMHLMEASEPMACVE